MLRERQTHSFWIENDGISGVEGQWAHTSDACSARNEPVIQLRRYSISSRTVTWRRELCVYRSPSSGVCLLKAQNVSKAGLITNEFDARPTIGELNWRFAASLESITKFLHKIPPVKDMDQLGKVYI